jgi:anti-sigma B factor antagonist
MSATVVIRHVEGITILDVKGRITLGEGGVTLRDAVHEAIKTGTKKLIIDLGGVSYMDSSGLGELTGAAVSAKNAGCDLKLLNLTKKLDDLMQITKLATIFDIYTDEKTALASFSA